MGWLLLIVLLVFGFPLTLALMGVALAIWIAFAVAGAVWAVMAFVLGLPVLGLILAVGIGVAIGRALPKRAT